jgi:hypothetical protein
MNLAEARRDELILSMDDSDLLKVVLGKSRDEALSAVEYDAFKEMQSLLMTGERQVLSLSQRAWVEEAARRVMPIDSSLVPRGREVEPPASLRRENLPLKPPSKPRMDE